jgi:hypothetical protein
MGGVSSTVNVACVPFVDIEDNIDTDAVAVCNVALCVLEVAIDSVVVVPSSAELATMFATMFNTAAFSAAVVIFPDDGVVMLLSSDGSEGQCGPYNGSFTMGNPIRCKCSLI